MPYATVEYFYTDLNTAICSASPFGVDADVTDKANVVRVGLNYRFSLKKSR